MRVLITGATGFVGSSLLRYLPVGQVPQFELSVAGRSMPFLPTVDFIYWDLSEPFISEEEFDVIIHAATPASALLNAEDPIEMYWLNVSGMKHLLDFVSRFRKPPKIVFTSSGAVYGSTDDDFFVEPEDASSRIGSVQKQSAYGTGKASAEYLLGLATNKGLCEGVIARLFAFSGPTLPLQRHFAIGNFVFDAVHKHQIIIRGDGTSVRSYLDELDMATWIWRLTLPDVRPGVFHIGSERAVNIAELASIVASRFTALTSQECPVLILGEKSPIDGLSRYVPQTSRTRASLKVSETVSLEESVDRMLLAELRR